MSPFKSKAQARKFAVLAGQGKISMATFREWSNATKNYKRLPEHKKKNAKK